MPAPGYSRWLVVASLILTANCSSAPQRFEFEGSTYGGVTSVETLVPPTPGVAVGGTNESPWHTATLENDRQSAIIHFSAGPARCWVLDRIEVRYANEVAIVTLFEGTTAAPGTVCLTSGRAAKTHIEFDRAVTSIRDGSTRRK